jgi:hypothetical protein
MVIFPVSLDTYPEVKTSAASLPYRSRELALQLDQRVVGAENLSSGVVVMKSAQDGKWPDHTGSLNRARNGRILVQGQVCPRLIIVASVRIQNPT